MEQQVKAEPATLRNAKIFYTALTDNAVEVDGKVLFTGHVVALAAELNIAGPKYAAVNRALVQMGCMEQIQQGNRHQQTVLQLFRPPTLELYSSLESDDLDTPKAIALRVAELTSQVNTIRASMGDVNIQEALIGLSQGIRDLNDKLQRAGIE